ncbi:MAG: hypothetical protein OQK82_03220 [Candidatus Pacearchaeota archaeon]|nr:hypothetical protein [Candidatus Pacearchaeota archaeon]
MAILIQKRNGIINITETTKPVGEQIIETLSVDCVAYPINKQSPENSIIQIIDCNGKPNRKIPFIPSLEIQNESGIAAPFIGTIDELINKLNSEFFIGDSEKDFELDVSSGKIIGSIGINRWGKNPDIDTGTIPEDIWDGGGIYVPPTANRIHQVKSTSIEDKGILRGTYTSTTFSTTALIDSTATFITDGVVVGDVVLNDTIGDHSIVKAVVSEIELTVYVWHHSLDSNIGNSFRVVGKGGTGAAVAHIKVGYMEDGTPCSEFIILNGTTNVPTIGSCYRINDCHIHGAGSNKSNVGTITFTDDVDANVTAQINPNNGRTAMAFIHVPIGYTFYLKTWDNSIFRTGAASDAMAELEIRSNIWGADCENLEWEVGVSVQASSAVVFTPHKKFAQGTDLWVRCRDISDSNTILFSGLNGVLVKNQ